MMAAELPQIGKISPEIFDQIFYPRLGRRSSKVLVGPQHGVDVGVVDLGGGQVMVSTCDPVFIVPAYGFARAAWFAVHILASDAATSGLPPTYMCIDLNLPPSITRSELEELWTTVHEECDRLGISVISGHTARYHGCEYPMVGGATVLCIGSKDRYVTPAMARVGDVVIVTKGAAIEAAGLMAVTFPDRLAAAYGRHFAEEASNLFYMMSVVEDALTAASVGVRDDGVTSMHDATECGVWGGLYEIAEASRVGMRIEQDRVPLRDDVQTICRHFGMDPYTSISEGTLLLTCRPKKAREVVQALAAKNILAAVVGEVLPAEDGVRVVAGGIERTLEHPRVDPFWDAFAKAGQEAAQ
jgi:hydrogenase expression/formation protein HypE